MTEANYVIRKLEGDSAERTVTVTAYSETSGEVVVTVPTSGMDADALPDAIAQALAVKDDSGEAANADSPDATETPAPDASQSENPADNF